MRKSKIISEKFWEIFLPGFFNILGLEINSVAFWSHLKAKKDTELQFVDLTRYFSVIILCSHKKVYNLWKKKSFRSKDKNTIAELEWILFSRIKVNEFYVKLINQDCYPWQVV